MLKNDDAYVPFAKYAYVIVRVIVVMVIAVLLLLLEMCCVRYNTTISTRDKRRSIRKHLWVFNITQSIHCWYTPAAAAAANSSNSFSHSLSFVYFYISFLWFSRLPILSTPGISLQIFRYLSPPHRTVLYAWLRHCFFYYFILASYRAPVKALLYYVCIYIILYIFFISFLFWCFVVVIFL